MADYSLIPPFENQSVDFALGFECGKIWERLKSEDAFNITIHAVNAEMVMRMCEIREREFRAETLNDSYLHVFIL